MKMKKRWTVLLCAACLAAGTIFSPVTGAAIYAEEGGTDSSELESGDYTYRVTEMGTAEILNYTGSEKDWVIPDQLEGLDVTGIVREAVAEVRPILERVTIPASMRSIEDGILYDKEKEEVVSCPRSKTGEVHLPEGVQRIKDHAFYGCQSLTEIEIPASVWSISQYAIVFCKKLENIVVDSDNRNYCSENGILYNLNKTLLLAYPGGRTEKPSLPESVTGIASNSFCGSRITDLEIPKNVTGIESGAFFGCQDLERIKLPKGLKNIEEQAFFSCEKLKDIFYAGSEEEWRAISIGASNESLTDARMHYNYCEHIYESSVTAEPTCTAAGVKTFTCSKCGNKYTEEIAKTAHVYQNGTCSLCGQADPAVANPSQTTPDSGSQTTPDSGSQAEQITVPTPKFSLCKNTKGKKITLKWKKVSKASGYRIQYSADKKFKKKTTKDCKKNAFTIKKLKKGKKYYVRIQAYRMVSGKRYDSGWSKAKGVKVAK